jgi:hypothetical protein
MMMLIQDCHPGVSIRLDDERGAFFPVLEEKEEDALSQESLDSTDSVDSNESNDSEFRVYCVNVRKEDLAEEERWSTLFRP